MTAQQRLDKQQLQLFAEKLVERIFAPPSHSDPADDRWMKMSSAAKYADCSVSTLRTAINTGELLPGSTGGGVRLRKRDIDAWLLKDSRQETAPVNGAESASDKAKRILAL